MCAAGSRQPTSSCDSEEDVETPLITPCLGCVGEGRAQASERGKAAPGASFASFPVAEQASGTASQPGRAEYLPLLRICEFCGGVVHAARSSITDLCWPRSKQPDCLMVAHLV